MALVVNECVLRDPIGQLIGGAASTFSSSTIIYWIFYLDAPASHAYTTIILFVRSDRPYNRR